MTITHSGGSSINIKHVSMCVSPKRRRSKTLLKIDERGLKMLETVFSIAICRQFGDKLQSKTVSSDCSST